MESPVPFIISSHISPASSRPFPPATVLISSSDIDPVGVPLLLSVPGVLVGRSPAYCYHFWKNASIFSNLSKIREAKSSSLFCSTRPTRLFCPGAPRRLSPIRLRLLPRLLWALPPRMFTLRHLRFVVEKTVPGAEAPPTTGGSPNRCPINCSQGPTSGHSAGQSPSFLVLLSLSSDCHFVLLYSAVSHVPCPCLLHKASMTSSSRPVWSAPCTL